MCSSPWVNVLDSGYKWNDEIYPTLTHIGWKTTGYQIGGNNFFGLTVKQRDINLSIYSLITKFKI